jgi:hypothetical protein
MFETCGRAAFRSTEYSSSVLDMLKVSRAGQEPGKVSRAGREPCKRATVLSRFLADGCRVLTSLWL